jgi:hypothetical protein
MVCWMATRVAVTGGAVARLMLSDHPLTTIPALTTLAVTGSDRGQDRPPA